MRRPMKKKKFRGPQRQKTGQMAAKVKKIVRKVLNRNMETKQSVYSSNDGTEIVHNSFITMDSDILSTSQGTGESMTSSTSNRIGDEISLKSVRLKFMVELNERYTDVTCRLLIVKKAKGDTLNTSTLFAGLSTNKMIDNINTERFTILSSKTFKLMAGNAGTLQNMQGGGSGFWGVAASSANQGSVLSRATKIVSLTIPAKKFTRNGKIQYENGTSQPKFFDYHAVLYAYSNWSTTESILVGGPWNVARLNDYVKIINYTDA